MAHRSLLTALAAAAITTTSSAEPFQMRWTSSFSNNDRYPSTFGPDGPWQAVVVTIGNGTSGRSGGVAVPLWPSGADRTQIITSDAGGNYSISNSTSVVKQRSSLGNSDSWTAQVMSNSTTSGIGIYDRVSLSSKMSDDDSKTVNASIAANDEWVFAQPSGTNYTAKVGILGLGPESDTGGSLSGRTGPGSIIAQMKASKAIESMSFALHIGSAAHEQPGSMVFGGYDQARALGPVGTFKAQGFPTGFLLDVTLGVEEGGSPFTKPLPASLFKGSGGSAESDLIVKKFGGPKGSVVVVPNPAIPYMYMPFGTCESIAEYLPVTWNKDLGLYTWNSAESLYSKIINSPAYLGIVIADKDAVNLTIKVPFQVLNLTLTPPLVKTPTQYFPCQPFNSSYGWWELGRAFLQSTFLAVDFEHNLTYMAQAPGPDMDQSVIKTIKATDTNPPATNPITSFRKSWINHWTVLSSDGSNPIPIKDPPSSSSGLSAGGIAGAVLGGLIILTVILGLILFCLRKQKKKKYAAVAEKPVDGSTYAEMSAEERERQGYYKPQEVSDHHGVSELGSKGNARHEMDARFVAEAPGEARRFEMA